MFPDASTAVLPSRLQFHDRLIALDARHDPLIITVCVVVGPATVGIVAEQVYQRLGIPVPGWFFSIFLVALLVGVTTAPMLYQWRLGVLAGRLGLNCPNCHRPVVGGAGAWFTHYTLRTRKCPECGSPVMN
jgi:hypothetical protein